MPMSSKARRRLLWMAPLPALVLAGAWLGYGGVGLLEIDHAPAHFARRAGDLTANVTGTLGWFGGRGEYRLNDGPWRPIGQGEPRAAAPRFVIELAAGDLHIGANRLALRAHAPLRAAVERELSFTYDPTPVVPPVSVDWGRAVLDVQDGRWEKLRLGDEWRVRPAPDAVGYDRILMVTGAFAGGRRVRSTVVLRDAMRDRLWGFGVMPLWGGHPDAPGQAPRRGWRYGVAWYYSRAGGFGCELAQRHGAEGNEHTATYRVLEPQVGVRHHLLAEAWPERDGEGRHAGLVLRGKCWPDGSPEPATWTETRSDARFPDGEYAVALLAHRSLVEFGPVHVEPITPGARPGR